MTTTQVTSEAGAAARRTARGGGAEAVKQRIAGIDLARGLAILGMFGAHILLTEALGWHPSTWTDLVNGRSSILFAVLAGVSVALMTGGTRVHDGASLRDARTRVLVRAVLLFALGSVLDMAGSIAVILEVYAILLAVSVLFLRWSPRRLFIAAGTVAVAGAAAVHLLDGLLEIWEWGFAGGVVGMTLGGTYPALIWSAFVLLGLGIGRLDLGARRVRLRLLAAGLLLAVLGYGGGWAAEKVHGPGFWSEQEWTEGSDADSDLGSGDLEFEESDDFGDEDFAAGDLDDFDEGSWEDPELVPAEDVDFTGQWCLPYDDGTVYCEPEDEAKKNQGIEEDWEDAGGYGDLFRGLPEMLVGAHPHSGTPFEVVGSSGFALLVLALCLLAPPLARRALSPVAAAGTMALTLYALHAVALKYTVDQAMQRPALVYAAFVVGALLFAVAWRRWMGQGPLERLLTTLSRRANRATVHRPAQDGPGQDGSGQDGPGQDRPGQDRPVPAGGGGGAGGTDAAGAAVPAPREGQG